VGLAAAAGFAIGVPFWTYAASGLFVLGVLLDRADGILARITGRTSERGHRFDLLADALCNALTFVGIGIGLRESWLGNWAMALGVIAGVTVSAVFWLVVRAEAAAGNRAAELHSAAGFDADDAMLLVPLAMALGWGVWLLCTAAVGAPVFALLFFWRFRVYV